jgi:hypothetical protein
MSKKTYSQEVATTIAAKLTESKGVEHIAHDVGNGKFKVLTMAEIEALTAPAPQHTAQPGPTISEDEVVAALKQPTTAAAQVANKTAAANAYANEVVQVTVPGKITKMYVITPVLGGRERWFEIARMKSKPEMVDGQVVFTCTRGTLLSRKLKELADNSPVVAA